MGSGEREHRGVRILRVCEFRRIFRSLPRSAAFYDFSNLKGPLDWPKAQGICVAELGFRPTLQPNGSCFSVCAAVV